MAEPILRMEPLRASVEPGGQVSAVVTVFNSGKLVEGYDLDVVAAVPLPWAQVSPPSLSVYPQQEATAVVTFAPPSGPGAPGGPIPFGVRVRSQVDPAHSAVIEGDLDVGSVSGLQAVLTPVTSAGRWSGRHTVKVSNWGNAPARLRISPRDADQALGFLVSPQVLDLPLGSEAVARLKVRTRHPVLRGSPQRLPFQVVCEPDVPEELGGPRATMSTPDRPVVDGTFNQKPILSRVVVSVAALVLLAGIGGLVYALTRSDGDDGPPPEQVTNPDTPTGFTAVDTVSPTKIMLVWDEAEDVDGFKLYYQNPDTEKRAPPLEFKDATSLEAELPPDTEMCFLLAAVREGKDSPLTEPTCSRTEAAEVVEESAAPGDPTPSVTVTPDISEVDGEPTTPPPNTTEPPQEFLTVLSRFSPDLETNARTEQERLAAAGVPAKLLATDDYVLELVPIASPTAAPTAPGSSTATADTVAPAWFVYVDSADPTVARDVCASAWGILEGQGDPRPADACFLTYRVLTEATGASSPTATP